MALETGIYISDLVSSNPAGTDTLDKADDHLRLIKSTVQATFPNIAGAVTPTHTELNYVDGVTSNIQAQLDAKSPLASPTFTGVVATQAGSAALPALIPTGDTNTGLWFPAADTIAASTAGSERIRIDTSGNVGIGGTPAAYASYTTLTLNGTDTDIDLNRGGVRQAAFYTSSTQVILGTVANVPLVIGTNNTNFVKLGTDQSLTLTGTGGLGYGTGSGGTVTQLTSKSTGVTLNKASGQITTTSAALAANTWVSFTVTNSVMTANDLVLAMSANGNYLAKSSNPSAGSFVIDLLNRTGGSLSDAVTIYYVIIKGANS